MGVVVLFVFKQKPAYEMRISDWSSDVCSSDLFAGHCGERQTQMLVAKGIDQIADAARPADRGQIIRQRRTGAHPAGEGRGEGQPEFADMAFQPDPFARIGRSEEQPSELQLLMRISYAVFCLTTKNIHER